MRVTIISALAFTLLPMASADPVSLDPGKWDMTVEATIFGQNVSVAEPECLEPEHAALEPSEIADLIEENLGCQATDMAQTQGQLSFRLSCPGSPFDQTSFLGEHASRSLKLNGTGPVGNILITGKHSGKACD